MALEARNNDLPEDAHHPFPRGAGAEQEGTPLLLAPVLSSLGNASIPTRRQEGYQGALNCSEQRCCQYRYVQAASISKR